MRADKMTHKFQLALSEAQSLAIGLDNQFIEPLHMMAALLDQEGSTARQVLMNANVDVSRLRSQLGRSLERLPKVEGAAGEPWPRCRAQDDPGGAVCFEGIRATVSSRSQRRGHAPASEHRFDP